MDTSLPEVIPCSCGDDCNWEGIDEINEPCYGKIRAIEEMWSDDDYYWVHTCGGHQNMYGGSGYIPFRKRS